MCKNFSNSHWCAELKVAVTKLYIIEFVLPDAQICNTTKKFFLLHAFSLRIDVWYDQIGLSASI